MKVWTAIQSRAVGKIVHEGFTDKEALEFFQDAIHS